MTEPLYQKLRNVLIAIPVVFLFSCSAELTSERETKLINEEGGSSYVDESGPFLVALSPFDGLSNVLTTAPTTLIFNEALDAKSVNNVLLQGNKCIGSFQLSVDNFNSCLPLKKPELLNQGQIVRLEPANGFEYVTTYRWRLTDELTDLVGNTLTDNYTMLSGFTTADSGKDTLPSQLAEELRKALRTEAGYPLYRSSAAQLQLSEAQIEALVEAAQQELQNSGNAYSLKLEVLLPSMLQGSLKRLGTFGTMSLNQRQTALEALTGGFVRMMLGKEEYLRSRQTLLEDLLRDGILELQNAGFTVSQLGSAADLHYQALMKNLEAAGLGPNEILQFAPTSALVPAFVEALEATEGKGARRERLKIGEPVALGGSSFSLLQQSLGLFAQSSMNVTSSWSWWSTSTTT